MNFRKKLRGFTLVEMLIVIVIIGVLAAALIPRLTSVRGRANDVARKADLQQIATAIVSYSMDKGEYPDGTTKGTINNLATDLQSYVSSLPGDPQGSSSMTEYTGTGFTDGEYVYIRATKGNVADAGFMLISKAETDGGANRAYLSGNTYTGGGVFSTGSDTQNITPCTKMTIGATGDLSDSDDCIYTAVDQLRYIIAR